MDTMSINNTSNADGVGSEVSTVPAEVIKNLDPVKVVYEELCAQREILQTAFKWASAGQRTPTQKKEKYEAVLADTEFDPLDGISETLKKKVLAQYEDAITLAKQVRNYKSQIRASMPKDTL